MVIVSIDPPIHSGYLDSLFSDAVCRSENLGAILPSDEGYDAQDSQVGWLTDALHLLKGRCQRASRCEGRFPARES